MTRSKCLPRLYYSQTPDSNYSEEVTLLFLTIFYYFFYMQDAQTFAHHYKYMDRWMEVDNFPIKGCPRFILHITQDVANGYIFLLN